MAEYRLAQPSPHEAADSEPLEIPTERGRVVHLVSLGEALRFARKHGVINLARP
jgi:hypothetical protein